MILQGLDFLEGDKLKLQIEYEGPLLGRGFGFFKTSYVVDEQNRQQLIGSKHEPTYARKSYPCFDEPSMKVPHTFRIVYSKFKSVRRFQKFCKCMEELILLNQLYPKDSQFFPLSNMPPDGEPVGYDDDSNVQLFQPTPPMSTYLSCWVISDFDYRVLRSHNRV